MALPPWLAPQNFVDAMAKGASAGLTRRGQSLAAGQHRAALALQRDQLQVATQQKAVEFMQAEARAAEALRQHNSLEAFRQQSLAEEQRMHALSAAAAQARQAGQDRAQDAREAHMATQDLVALEGLDLKRQQAADRTSGKEYGEIETMDLTPDVGVAFRRGSPGMHVFNKKTKTNELTPAQVLNVNMRARSMLKLGPNEKPDDPVVQERMAFAKGLLEQSPIKNSAGESLRVTPEVTQPPDNRPSILGMKLGRQPGPVTNMVPQWVSGEQQGTNAPAADALSQPASTNAPPESAPTPPVNRSTVIAKDGVTPANANAATAGVIVRRKSDGKTFRYKGDAKDVPADQFDILE